jgi:ABC-type transport system involved in multi-copper enzyme maturation permease subunit
VFFGVGLVTKEVEKRSVYGLLTKPLSRAEFLLGKYAGLVMTIAVNLAVMTVALYGVLFYSDLVASAAERAGWTAPAVDPRMLISVILILAELMLVVALALFFSSFSSPLWATLLTLGLWVAGHFNSDLRNFGAVVDSAAVAWIARVIYYVIPNLSPFDVKAEVVHGISIAASHVAYTLLYAALYIAILLTASITIFSRRDFK